MCFVKSKYEKKKQLFIHYKYFAGLYRSFVNYTYIYTHIYIRQNIQEWTK